MNCEESRNAIVGDDSAELAAAERHAARCPDCAELFRGDAQLAAEVERWKRATPAPADDLERRIATAIAAESQPARRPVARAAWWLSAAASLLIAGWLGTHLLSTGQPGLTPTEKVMREADLARDQYVSAIAELERQAVPVLDRASDPGLHPSQAAILLRYRDRLNHLDSVIAEVRGFLDENPGHGGGHTVLLAAYQEKQQVLGELLQLQIGDPS